MKDIKKRKRNETSNGSFASEVTNCKDKRFKNGAINGEIKANKTKVVKKKIQPEKCDKCKEFLDKLTYYNGHPNNSNEEAVALSNENLFVFTGNEKDIDETDQTPVLKLTHFSVYDDYGHLCAFDTGIIEEGVYVYFSGYMKPIYEEDPSTDNGIPSHHLGPINEWWSEGFDGGDKVVIGFTTNYAIYYLMEPSGEYRQIYESFLEKIKISKIIIEFLLENNSEMPGYEDLVEYVENAGYLGAENLLMKYADFIYEQIVNYDKACPEDELDELPLHFYPCIQTLVSLCGITYREGGKAIVKNLKTKKAPSWSKAVTTKLVKEVFEKIFPDQIDSKNDDVKGPKKRRCGVCEGCLTPNCGQCINCKDMIQFGGGGVSKKACNKRICSYMTIFDNQLSDSEDSEEPKIDFKREKVKNFSKKLIHSVKWLEKSDKKFKGQTCYSSAEVGDDVINLDDFILINSSSDEPSFVGRVVSMYDKLPQKFLFHCHLFSYGSDTILGETADPKELFIIDDCVDLPLGSIVRKTKVEYRKISDDWFLLGGNSSLEQPSSDAEFFYAKRFEKNRFVDVDVETEILTGECISCKRQKVRKMVETPILKNDVIFWRNEEYKVGSGVFLLPGTYKFESFTEMKNDNDKENEVDEDIYPEFYRKRGENNKGSNHDTPDPFIVGKIEKILNSSTNIIIKVRIYFRPENIVNATGTKSKDLNLVYYTEKIIDVSFENVRGKCYIEFGEILEEDTFHWSQKGPYRFYFDDMYDIKKNEIKEVPFEAKKEATKGKGKGKGKLKQELMSEIPPSHVKPSRALASMDIFAGCGGLSEGLHQSGITTTKWAIEFEKSAAKAFQMNNPECRVFADDCNSLLNMVLTGNGKQRQMPDKGEVEMLVGGPPCQGFSGMNRFTTGQYSLFKNSLVVTFLSYCEYYRPKYFILENVRNFVTFKKGMVLKLTIRCLLAIGYQVIFGVVQAGHYGVPQTRRRFILMAAAPGYPLPKYPEPLHVFNKRGCQLSFVIDNNRYDIGCFWENLAPYRTITVRDAISDLPQIPNGWSKTEIPYGSDPMSHYQKLMRGKDEVVLLKDHICKEMSPLVEARILHIPTYQGADWRDLPNIEVVLKDDAKTDKLLYNYRLKKQKGNRGVCRCAVTGKCDPTDRQTNTLIPWCLPHTADRHNNWAGLYGRLEWDGYFGTTITNPEPMGKQGRVLHPTQNRVVSVRECARSQGFPDRFKFFGGILDKHRQVGNAVPPPLGVALGLEICKALMTKKQNSI